MLLLRKADFISVKLKVFLIFLMLFAPVASDVSVSSHSFSSASSAPACEYLFSDKKKNVFNQSFYLLALERNRENLYAKKTVDDEEINRILSAPDKIVEVLRGFALEQSNYTFESFVNSLSPKELEIVSPAIREALQTGRITYAQYLRMYFVIQERETSVAKMVRSSTQSPEEFLACIETVSKVQAYEGFKFEDALASLSERQLKKLYKTINRAIKKGDLTEYDQNNLLVDIYRLTHRPKGILGSLWQTKDVREAFDKVDDQVIQERIELSLFKEGMPKAFDVIIRDPILKTRFYETLQRNAPWIDTSVAVALWGAGVFAGGDVMGVLANFPPYFPGLQQYLTKYNSAKINQVTRNEGLDAGAEATRVETKLELKQSRLWGLARSAYLAAFASAFMVAVHPVIEQKAQQVTQEMVQERGQKTVQKNDESIDYYLTVGKMTPEQQGIESYNKFVEFLKKNHIQFDPNSPEMLQEREKRIRAFIIANQKKSQS